MEQNKNTSFRLSGKTKLIPRDISESLGKLPPQALELEEAVLGAAMLERSAIETVVDIVHSGDFYSEAHVEIWNAILELYRINEPVDMRTVVAQLRKSGKIELIGGAYKIAELTSKVSSAANIEWHARVVLEMSIKRQLIQVASHVHQQGYEDGTDAIALLEMVQMKTDEITGLYFKGKYRSAKDLVYDVIKKMQEKPSMEGVTGVPCGIEVVDRMLGGFQTPDLVIIAARPGMGKTVVALEFAKGSAMKFKVPVGFFSLEMDAEQLTLRMISSETEIDSEKLRKRQLADHEWVVLTHKTNALSAAPLFIDDTPSLNILELRAKARRMKNDHNIGMLVVDYLQLMKGAGESNREQEIAGISRGLKGLAKELKIPVLACAQLSRAPETRTGDKRAQLSDLRESGSIEQDADVVIFPFRPEYYGIAIDEEGLPTNGLMELNVAKHRSGKTGAVKVKYIGKYSKIQDFDKPPEPDNPFSGMIGADRKAINPAEPEHPLPGTDDTPF